MPFAFFGATEIFLILLVGLLLFGGQLPDVAKDLGRSFFKAKRSLDEIRRDSGIDDALRDLEKEANSVQTAARDFSREAREAASAPDWRQAVDHAAGPGAEEGVSDGETEQVGLAESENDAIEGQQGEDSQQSTPRDSSEH